MATFGLLQLKDVLPKNDLIERPIHIISFANMHSVMNSIFTAEPVLGKNTRTHLNFKYLKI